MLEEIRLAGLGVIAEAVLPLSGGFTVLTGETGAGKTMLLSALNLLCGGRADAALVRPGAARATVEGRVHVDPESPAGHRAVEAGADFDEDGTLVVRRSIGADGRSRAILGGAGVPNGVLADVVAPDVVVHGQADQQRLASTAQQREILDRYAGEPAAAALAGYTTAYETTRHLAARVAQIESETAVGDAEIERLRYALERIEALAPVPGEDVVLASRIDRLSHAEALAVAVEEAHAALAGQEDSSVGAGPGAETSIASAARSLAGQAQHDPALAALAERTAELAILTGELRTDLAAYQDGLAVDPAELERANERLAALRGTARSYSPHDPSADGLLAWSRLAADRLAGLDGRDDRLATARAALEASVADLEKAAVRLREVRTAAAGRLAERAGAEFAGLALPGARLVVEVKPAEPAPHGGDAISFQFAAHPDAPLRPVGRGASGGERSRVMLALEVVLAGADPVASMVFDEVDAGVGGQAAVEVGARLAELAGHHQVLVVTHLPQVAAFADRHVRVRKDATGGVGVSDVEVLDDDERIVELARMLAGQSDSGAAREHARELLSVAAERRHSRGKSGKG